MRHWLRGLGCPSSRLSVRESSSFPKFAESPKGVSARWCGCAGGLLVKRRVRSSVSCPVDVCGAYLIVLSLQGGPLSLFAVTRLGC